MKLQTLLVLGVALALGGGSVWLIAPLVMSRGDAGNSVAVVIAGVDIARGATIQAGTSFAPNWFPALG